MKDKPQPPMIESKTEFSSTVNRMYMTILGADEDIVVCYHLIDKTFNIFVHKGAETIYQLLHLEHVNAAQFITRGLLIARTDIDWWEQGFPGTADWLRLVGSI